MAAQTMSPNRHNRPNAHGTAVPYGSQPGSPTLTNPDMILPDYNDPDSYPGELIPPPVMPWNTVHSIEDGFQFTQEEFYVSPDPFQTPIIYGNGTMLSDIGEVTEVESNAGTIHARSGSRHSNSSDEDAPLQSSPTMGKGGVIRYPKYIRRERRDSNDSNSTIHGAEKNVFADFDDAASVGGDSNFQGDDEESVASSFMDDMPLQHPALRSKRNVAVKRLSDESAANNLSRRAEEILANAKLRLTNMEDNLTRARTLSYSSVSEASTPSPQFDRPSTSHRGNTTTSTHARNMSEMGVAGSSKVARFPQRSASALGAAGGYRRALPTSKSVDHLGGASGRGAYTQQSQLDAPLEQMSEDEEQLNEDSRGGVRLTSYSVSSFGGFETQLSRSSSVASSVQMRDIQDQMKGLKGKISSLREQARADSMKRRSLQSLRGPSPFTHSTWDPGFSEANDLKKMGGDKTDSVEHVMENFDGPAEEDEDIDDDTLTNLGDGGSKIEGPYEIDGAFKPNELLDGPETDVENDLQQSYGVPRLHDGADESFNERTEGPQIKDDSAFQSDTVDMNADDTVSESGDSLYHDTFQKPISHEDREDAFDYERFFLHSALGNVRSRSGSQGSDDSVETTRGPGGTRQRRSSVDTTTSVDTFETATEGQNTRSSTAQGCRVYTPADLFDHSRSSSRYSLDRSESDISSFNPILHRRQVSAMQRPVSISSMSTLHRPSYSSFESTGTNRSFPLINKTKINGGMATPGGSPDHGLKQIAESFLSDATSIHEKGVSIDGRGESPAMQSLRQEDQLSIEKLVASLGKCVLALSETSEPEDQKHELYRRRIEAARRILEGEMELS